MVHRVAMVSLALLILVGCSSEPPIAGGKPVDHWLEMASDADPKIRVQAIQKLGNIGAKDATGIDAIIEALSDSDPAVRKEAILAVVRIGNSCRAAFPKLEEMSHEDAVEGIRKLAEEAHGNLVK